MIIPHCDIKTGKIYGCEKDSFLWWHEKGHIEFNKLDSTSSLKVLQNYAFAFWMFSTTFSILNIYMLFMSIPTMLFYLGIDIYEERWCNKYANSKIYKNR